MSQRHGERGNRLSEAFYFRGIWWRRMFESNGWTIDESFTMGLTYSGNSLFGKSIPLDVRRNLAGVLGSATRGFVLRKNLADEFHAQLRN